ncbi:MAG: extracellular solute-binding protein [Anaerococcus sp.]|uniref:extracellular solute-binding protein n=1 Tax=Anaerococcus sp. TaxID=1872515 RepID=UPI002633C6C9|nr:extracellular solute-binding protein [Anaerococcus sp.]MCI5972244.1 extracellular solute-binding protein [Anaerococcus sp.]
MKNNKRFIIRRMVFFLIVLINLTSCSNKEEKSADGRVVIEFFNQKKEMVDTLEEIVKDFEKENPDIKVNMTSVPDAGTVLKTRMLAGDSPDIVNIYPQNMDFKEWAKAGYFKDLSGASYLDNIVNDYEEKYAIDGKIYNVPLSANFYCIYYNKTKFDELGLKVPETWEEFEKLVEDIKAKGEVPFAVAGSEGWTLNGYHQLSLINITGSDEAANDYLRYSDVNSINENDETLVKDSEYLDLLADKGNAQKNWEGASYNDSVVAYATEKSLMLAGGSWVLAAISQQNPEFEVATFAFPGVNKGEEVTVGAGDLALSISENTKHPDEAERFLEYMTSKEAMQKYYDVDGSPVAVKGVKENEDSPLAPLYKLAFTDRHYVWLGQEWNSEEDFFQATTNYLLTQDRAQLAKELNAFFNPMKASNKKE